MQLLGGGGGGGGVGERIQLHLPAVMIRERKWSSKIYVKVQRSKSFTVFSCRSILLLHNKDHQYFS